MVPQRTGPLVLQIYLVGSSYLPEIGHVGNGTHWESLVNKTIVDKHVRHPKHRNSKSLYR